MKKETMKKTVMKKKFVYLLILIVFIIIISTTVLWNNRSEKITNFEECAAAGYPVMESYPRQCNANSQIFIEEIYTQIYGIVSLKGELFCPCFLVSGAEVWYDLMNGKPAVDVSDINNGDFVVVKGEFQGDGQLWAIEIHKAAECKPEDREGEFCIEVYDPVCGYDSSGNAIRTFSNSCFACLDTTVSYYLEGGC